jgi:prepilin-type N-terminal cleavage/methylation domain-containing protein
MKPNIPSRFPRLPRRLRAFTLIEFLGVLAIIAILAAIIGENVLSNMRKADRDAESASLANLATGLTQSVVRLQYIPATTNWISQVADAIGKSISAVATNKGKNPRVLLVDPSFDVGTNLAATGNGLPFTQDFRGSQTPVGMRMLLISSTSATFPTLYPSFDTLWNLPKDTVPSTWNTWKGGGQDIRIQRIDLHPLFHRVVLNNLDGYRTAPYSVENTNIVASIPSYTSREFWLIHNTALNLHTRTNDLQCRQYVYDDVSYTYENGAWNRYIYGGQNRAGGAFGDMVAAFLAAPEPPNPKFYSDKQAIVDGMFDYMYYIGLWATDGYPPEQNAARPQIPEFRQGMDAQERLSDTSYNLIN